MRVVFYISGHGFGHARRASEIIRQLVARHCLVYVRTSAPASIFTEHPLLSISAPSLNLDSGAVEDNVLTINPAATLQQLATVVTNKESIISEELRFLEPIQPDIILADIPFLAGDVARRAGVPCIGISNFTWDWIYEPFLHQDSICAPLLAAIRESYRKMDALFQLPFSHPTDLFREVVPIPMVVEQRANAADVIMEEWSQLRNDPRPKVLMGLRSGVPFDVFQRASARAPDYLFLYPAAEDANLPKNVLAIPPAKDHQFRDLMDVADIVISKLGYGIITDAIVSKTALLYPKRINFREDRITSRAVGKYLRAQELQTTKFYQGDWGPALDETLALRAPSRKSQLNGAEICVEALFRRTTTTSSSRRLAGRLAPETISGRERALAQSVR